MRRVTVIGNCHCLPIAYLIALGSDDLNVDFIDVNFLDHSPFKERSETLPTDDDGSRLIFSFSFHQKWDAISTTALRPIYGERLVTFTNLHFSGLYPDITYLGKMGSRKVGIMRDYHSKLVLYALVSGRSVADTVKLFDDENLAKVGYYGYYDVSKAELRQRDEGVDVKFAEEFFSIVEREPAMLTINHPTPVVFQALAARLCAHTGLKYTRSPAGYLTNPLSDNCIWPIYDPLAAYHNLPYRTPQRFIGPNGPESRGMDLHTFVARSFADYGASPMSEAQATVQALPFYASFQAALG